MSICMTAIPLPVHTQATPPISDCYFDSRTTHRRRSAYGIAPKLVTMHASSEPLVAPKAVLNSPKHWKKTLVEIKRDYSNRRYRACSDRCIELVGNTKGQVVENAYLIYARFYAASAIEMQVRTLQQNSSYRTKLLLQAREHYRAASDLAAAEDASMSRSSSRSFSPVPSLHSSSASNASRSTASSIRTPSPTLSVRDSCLKSSKSAPKPKKRVAFIGVPAYEPIVRPDSPTLGFDDWFSPPASPETMTAMPSKPAPEPEPLRYMEKSFSSLPLPSPTLSVMSTDSSLSSSPSLSDDDEPLADCFGRQRSIHQYCTVLRNLQRQITSHLTWIDQDITAALATQPPIMTDELRALELRTRIERLRANGWKRKRFDASRYEALRESALADIN